MTLGEKISSLRGAANMSQGDLAEKLNVSRQSISKWETDASVPELDKLIRMSEFFEISLDELVYGRAPDKTENSSTKTFTVRTVVCLLILLFGQMIQTKNFQFHSFFNFYCLNWSSTDCDSRR